MSSMSLFFHHTEIANTTCSILEQSGDTNIHAELKNRNGGCIHLFFDCVDDVERMADELMLLAENIRERESKDFCAETGEVLS